MARHGANDWSGIAKRFNKDLDLALHRLPKSLRERWRNHLDPGVDTSPLSSDGIREVLGIINQQLAEQGHRKISWAKIAVMFADGKAKHHSDNTIKNTFNSLLRSELLIWSDSNQLIWNPAKKR